MIKNIVTSFFFCLAAFPVIAAEGSVDFTYAGDDCGAWGKSKSEIYDIAMRINQPELIGKKITSIRAIVNAYEDVEATSLWLSKELTLQKEGSVKVNVPDTYSADVSLEKVELPGFDDYVGQLSVVLDTPYEITDAGIYVGYSLTVPAVENGVSLTDKQKQPVLFSSGSKPESLYIRASKDFLKWVEYNTKLGASALIYVTIEGEFPEYSVGLAGVASAFAPMDTDFGLKAEIFNHGIAEVSSIAYAYTIEGKDYENTLEFTAPLSPDFANNVHVELPISGLSELGPVSLDISITKVNGKDNENILNSAGTQVSVIPYVPKHRPMLEEFTGTWCGWCTRGYYALEALNELYGDDIVLAAYHNSDPMQVTTEYPVSGGGYPSSTLNRSGVEDPYYGRAEDGFGMKDEVLQSMETVVPVDITVDALWEDEARTRISVEATSVFFENMQNPGYKVGFLLINNGMTGSTQSWLQSNNYAGAYAAYAGTDLEVLTTWPSKVMGLVFNDVVVDVTGMKGVEGSLPKEIIFNEQNSTEFSFDISGNDVIQDKDQLYVAAFVVNPDGSILNANKTRVVDSSAVRSVDSGAVEVGAEYYSLSGTRVSSPAAGIYVKVAKMSDGSIRTKKITLR